MEQSANKLQRRKDGLLHREKHHQHTKNIDKQNSRLAMEFGFIGNLPRIQWMLTDELYADVRHGYDVFQTLVKPVENDPLQPTQEPIPLHIARADSQRFTVADANGYVLWTLAQFILPIGNNHQQYQASLSSEVQDSSRYSYVCVPNGELDYFDWPDENLTTCMIALIKRSLHTLPEWVRDTRRRNLEARRKGMEKRLAYLKDKVAFNGAPFLSMVNGGPTGRNYSNSFRTQLAHSTKVDQPGDNSTGPVVLAS